MSANDDAATDTTSVPVNVRVPRADHEALSRLAEVEDRSMSQMVRRAIRVYLRERRAGRV